MTQHPKFVGYTSAITRQVGGYKVMESDAEARINANGEVVAEHVYWPELPSRVLTEAQAFDAMLSDPVRGPAYRARLPTADGAGEVVIHHSSALEASSFVVTACYDAKVGGRAHHFDVNGSEFQLVQESRAIYKSSPKP
jgi:hypothetical protein